VQELKLLVFHTAILLKTIQYFLFRRRLCRRYSNSILGKHLKSIPGNHVPSADTILRGIKELSTQNTSFTSNQGKTYDFNINKQLNTLNIKSLLLTKQLKKDSYYDFDYDNQIIATEKYDAKHTYKHTKGYFPGVATIGNKIVYIENRDGNANVKLEQASTLSRAYNLLKEKRALKIKPFKDGCRFLFKGHHK